MDNWSDNRSKSAGPSKSATLEKIGQVNAVLRMLANDEDLQDDLKTKEVKTAINHWTGIKRLSPEEAGKFQDHRRCLYVLQKFQVLQQVCKEAGMAVPLDHLMSRQKELSNEFVVKQFGSQFDLSQSSNSTKSSLTSSKLSAKSADKPVQKPQIASKVAASAQDSETKSEEPAAKSETSEGSVASTNDVKPSSSSSDDKTEVVTEKEKPQQPQELTDKQKRVLWERMIARRCQEATVLIVILTCIFMKWYYD